VMMLIEIALYRKCCLSINGACATPVYVLFHTGTDPISFVNRKELHGYVPREGVMASTMIAIS
jgi:hypothetical protein